MTSSIHPLDEALALTSSAPGQFTGQTHPGYWNMVGPFGGVTAATLLQAVMQHPQRLGDPLSLTVNYAGALVAGPFTVQATPVRTNRSTQHWTLSILQADAEGAHVVTTTATAVTAVRRDTWSAGDVPMPGVPQPADLPAIPPGFGSEWLSRYEMRPVTGTLPRAWDGSGDHSLTQLWMRDAPPRRSVSLTCVNVSTMRFSSSSILSVTTYSRTSFARAERSNTLTTPSTFTPMSRLMISRTVVMWWLSSSISSFVLSALTA